MMLEPIAMINTTQALLYVLCLSPGILFLLAPLVVMYKLQDKERT